MSDGANTIDDLQIKINGEAKSANSSIDNLTKKLGTLKNVLSSFSDDASFLKGVKNIASGFGEIARNLNAVDTRKLKDMSNSLNSFNRSAERMNDTISKLDFSKASTESQVLQKNAKSLSGTLTDYFNIQDRGVSKEIEKSARSFLEANMALTQATKGTEEWEQANRKLSESTLSIKENLRENARIIDESKTIYRDLIEYIQAQNKSGQKVFLPFNPSEFINDYSSMRSTLGKAFTSDEKYRNAPDISSFVSEMNSVIGHVVDVENNAAQTFENLVNIMRDARNSTISYDEAVKRHIPVNQDLAEVLTSTAKATARQAEELRKTQSAIPKGENNFTFFADQLKKIETIQVPDSERLSKFASAMREFGFKKMDNAVSNMPKLAEYLKMLESINIPETEKINEFVNSISQLGFKKIDKAIENLPKLARELKKVMDILSKAPTIKQDTIDLTNALAKLASQGGKVGTASRSINSGLGKTSLAMGRMKRHSFSLASALGKFYASYFLLIRGTKGMWQSIKSAMDYVEVLNYFEAGFGQVAETAKKSFKEAGYESAESYANSFEERAKKVTEKMSGFKIDTTGQLVPGDKKSLGMSPTELMNYQAVFAQMSNSMGVTAETSLKLSNALTKIGGDLASVKNMDFNQVWTDMQSGLVGMSRTLDKYGVNIRNVNMQQKLTELGINANIQAMNQNDKALLRTIILLDSSRYAWGDLANTINQPANQLRLVKASFMNLARTLGELFIPIIAKVLPIINALLVALQRLAYFIGKLFGVKFQGSSGGKGGGGVFDFGADADALDDAAVGAGNLGSGLGHAADNAKKLRDHLLSIDELNVYNEEEPSTGGGGGGGGGVGGGVDTGLLESALDKILDEYERAWDEAFSRMEERANRFADNVAKAFKEGGLEGVGEYLSKALEEQLRKIDWEKIYEGARTFGTGLANFLNGLIRPETFGAVGMTVANSLNTAIQLQLSFSRRFDFENLGESIAQAINEFFENFNWEDAGKTIVSWLDGAIKAIATFIRKLDYTEVVKAVYKLLKGVIKEAWERLKKGSSLDILEILNLTKGPDVVGVVFKGIIKDSIVDEIKREWNAAQEWWKNKNPLEKVTTTYESFKDKVSEKWNEAKNWWKNKKVLEKVQTTYESFKDKVSEKWNEAKNWWNNKEWLSKVQTTYESFRDKIAEKWSEAKNWWESKEWLSKVKTTYESFKDKVAEKWNEAKRWWENNKTLSSVKVTISSIVDALSSAVNKAKNWWNEHKPKFTLPDIKLGIKLPVPTITWDEKGFAAKAWKKFGFQGTPVFGVNWKQFKTGGFPDTGDFFFANENGVPELVGTMGGRTAVASGMEITGIKEAVYESGNEQARLLSTAIKLLQIISEKDTSFEIDGREIVNVYDERKRRNGYSFT